VESQRKRLGGSHLGHNLSPDENPTPSLRGCRLVLRAPALGERLQLLLVYMMGGQ
jgi:hypothetical protein